MFICQACKKVTPLRTPMIKVVVATRVKTYNNGFDEDGLPAISRGSEIVKEIGVCPTCIPKPEGHA